MELTVVIIIAVVALWVSSSRARKKREALIEEMWDLRFPTLADESTPGDTLTFEWFVDFKEMLSVEVTDDYNRHEVRLCALRRSDGPVWEEQEQFESWRRNKSWERGLGDQEEKLAKQKAGPRWERIENPKL